MANEKVQIRRATLELGVLSRVEAQELLAAGFLLPTDLFRESDAGEWRPLTELRPAASSATRALGKVRDAAVSIGEQAAHVATRLASAAGRRRVLLGAAGNRLLEDFLPKLRAPVARALKQSTQTISAALRDEPFLRKLFGATYDTLPRPVQRFVDEQAFIEFCLRHRNRLLGKTD